MKTKLFQISHTGKEKKKEGEQTNTQLRQRKKKFFLEQKLDEWCDNASFQEAQIVAIPCLQTLVRLEPATSQTRIGGVSRYIVRSSSLSFSKTK